MVMHSTRHARRGAALMEALMGGTILAIGLAALVSFAANALSRQQMGEERVIAASLVDELLNMVLVEGPLDFPKRQDVQGAFPPPFEQFTYRVDIVEQSESEPYLVTASVSWLSRGHVRDVTIRTLISQQRGEGVLEPREPGEPITR
jgi:hypothetical protein